MISPVFENEFIVHLLPFIYPTFQCHHPFGIYKYTAFIGVSSSHKAVSTAFMSS